MRGNVCAPQEICFKAARHGQGTTDPQAWVYDLQILAQLLGEQDLPWEGSRAAPDTMRKLRTLRSPVLALLERDPNRRLSMQQFCEACDDIFCTRTYKPAI